MVHKDHGKQKADRGVHDLEASKTQQSMSLECDVAELKSLHSNTQRSVLHERQHKARLVSHTATGCCQRLGEEHLMECLLVTNL